MKKILLLVLVVGLAFSTTGVASAKVGDDNPGKRLGQVEERINQRNIVSTEIQMCLATFRVAQDVYLNAKRTARDTYLAAMKTARNNYLTALKVAKESKSKDAAKLAKQNYSVAKKRS